MNTNVISTFPIGYVYETLNLVNGKTYIGLRHYAKDKHWNQYLGSGVLLRQAVEKYGRQNFQKKLLAIAYSEAELQNLEWLEIQRAKALAKAEYNLFTGIGAGGDTFDRLSSERLREFKRRQSKRMKTEHQNGWNQKHNSEHFEFSSSQKLKILDMYLKATSMKEIAIKLGFPYFRVRDFLSEEKHKNPELVETRRSNLPSVTKTSLDLRKSGERKLLKQHAMVVTLATNPNVSLKEMAVILGVIPKTIKRYCLLKDIPLEGKYGKRRIGKLEDRIRLP